MVHATVSKCMEASQKKTSLMASCRFFPSVYYLSTSKIAIAVLGNFAFAAALCFYFLLTKVRHPSTGRQFPSQIVLRPHVCIFQWYPLLLHVHHASC